MLPPPPHQAHTPDAAVAAGTDEVETSIFWQQVAAESIGWQPLDNGAYMHAGAGVDAPVIEVVGLADASMTTDNVLLLHW